MSLTLSTSCFSLGNVNCKATGGKGQMVLVLLALNDAVAFGGDFLFYLHHRNVYV